MTLRDEIRTHIMRRCVSVAAFTGCALLGVQPALAENGDTTVPSACMQEVFGLPVTGSNKLNCTANDIKISEATSFSPASCIEGELFDLTATFTTNVTANERYDATFFFNVRGGPNARGNGSTLPDNPQCSATALLEIDPAEDLDGDTCGDLNAGSYPLVFTIPDVLCTPNENGFLSLPNCTSWHSNEATTCDIGEPSTYDPETKSKCVCDDDFFVPVVVKPTGTLLKRAQSATVHYTVTVQNTSPATVNLTRLCDDKHGTIFGTGCPGPATGFPAVLPGTDCGPTELSSQEIFSCGFDVRYTQPGGQDALVTDTVKATLADKANPQLITEPTGSASVKIYLP